MKNALSTFLALLIFACPLVCGAVEAGHGAPAESEAGAPTDGHHSADCPEDADNCVCQGALQSSDVRVPHSDALPMVLLPFAHLGGLAASRPQGPAHLDEGSGPARAGGAALRVRLQNFRF